MSGGMSGIYKFSCTSKIYQSLKMEYSLQYYIQKQEALQSLPRCTEVANFFDLLGCDIRPGGVDAVPFKMINCEEMEVDRRVLDWLGLPGPYEMQVDIFKQLLAHRPELRPYLEEMQQSPAAIIKTAAIETVIFLLNREMTLRTWRHLNFLRIAMQKFREQRPSYSPEGTLPTPPPGLAPREENEDPPPLTPLGQRVLRRLWVARRPTSSPRGQRMVRLYSPTRTQRPSYSPMYSPATPPPGLGLSSPQRPSYSPVYSPATPPPGLGLGSSSQPQRSPV